MPAPDRATSPALTGQALKGACRKVEVVTMTTSTWRPRAQGRRYPRRPRWSQWSALTALPPTATPRGSAVQVGLMFGAGGVGALVQGLLTASAAADVWVAAGAVSIFVAAAVLRLRELPRPLLHVLLVSAVLLGGAVIVAEHDVATGLAISTGYVLISITAVATCSWVGAAGHAVLTLGCVLAQHVLTGSTDWTPSLVVAWMLLISCVFTGRLVRIAADAEVDALTGLVNRRGAERHLDEAAAEVALGAQLSVAVIDLDHFKTVNDTLGHGAGDELLREVAQCLETAARSQTPPAPRVLVARWGGDEFVLAAPTNPSRLADVIDSARRLLPTGASCSAGVTAALPHETPSQVLARADEALYQVKRSTRGHTVVFGPTINV